MYAENYITRTNIKEEIVDVKGWNYIETTTTKIIECDGYFMVHYKNLNSLWMNKKICLQKIGRDEGLVRLNKFINILNLVKTS